MSRRLLLCLSCPLVGHPLARREQAVADIDAHPGGQCLAVKVAGPPLSVAELPGPGHRVLLIVTCLLLLEWRRPHCDSVGSPLGDPRVPGAISGRG